MAITMTQTCEMCGRKRDLPTTAARPKMPHPDSGGWRLLSVGAKEATLCNFCVGIVVDHARARAAARQDGHPGIINERPLIVQFAECRD